MSIFGSIVSAIFGTAKAAGSAVADSRVGRHHGGNRRAAKPADDAGPSGGNDSEGCRHDGPQGL